MVSTPLLVAIVCLGSVSAISLSDNLRYLHKKAEKNGYVIEPDYANDGPNVVLKKRNFPDEWFKGGKYENDNFKMVLNEGSSDAVPLKLRNKKSMINCVPGGTRSTCQVNDSVNKTTQELASLTTVKDKGLLYSSAWYYLNQINSHLNALLSDRCKLGTSNQMKIFWSEEPSKQIASMSTTSPHVLTLARVEGQLTTLNPTGHASVDTVVFAHELSHYYTGCHWSIYNHNRAEQTALNEAIADVFSLVSHAVLFTDFNDPAVWNIGNVLGLGNHGLNTLRRYYPQHTNKATDQQEPHLKWSEYDERGKLKNRIGKGFYFQGQIIASAMMEAIHHIYELDKPSSKQMKNVKYAQASQVMGKAILGALAEYSSTNNDGGKIDWAGTMSVINTQGGVKNEVWRGAHTFLAFRDCLLVNLKKEQGYGSKSGAEIAGAAWKGFASYGMGVDAAYIHTITGQDFIGAPETKVTYRADNTAGDGSTPVSCKIPDIVKENQNSSGAATSGA